MDQDEKKQRRMDLDLFQMEKDTAAYRIRMRAELSQDIKDKMAMLLNTPPIPMSISVAAHAQSVGRMNRPGMNTLIQGIARDQMVSNSLPGIEEQDNRVEMRLEFPIGWWNDGRVAYHDEMRARALLLVVDRLNEAKGFSTKSIGMDNYNASIWAMIRVLPEGVAQAIEVRNGIVGELDTLPGLGTALCPCGCKADLTIRECRRQRMAVKEGVVCITPPAVTARDQAHPDHKGHGVQGWNIDRPNRCYIMACGCGAALAIGVRDAGSYVDRMDDFGGPAAEAIKDAIAQVYEMSPAQPMILNKSRLPGEDPISFMAGVKIVEDARLPPGSVYMVNVDPGQDPDRFVYLDSGI